MHTMEIHKNQTNSGVIIMQKLNPGTCCDGIDQHLLIPK